MRSDEIRPTNTNGQNEHYELFLFLGDRWVELGAPEVIGPIAAILDSPDRLVDCFDPFRLVSSGASLVSSFSFRTLSLLELIPLLPTWEAACARSVAR